jgi:flagellar motor switch protein FliG
VENEAKLAEANLMKEEKEIMLADMSSLSPTQRSWIEIMQKKILAKLISS